MPKSVISIFYIGGVVEMMYLNFFEVDRVLRITLRIAVGITGIIMLVLLLTGSVNAATLAVCKNGCAYSSIQDAVNAAGSGDTIQVQNGTYYENVNVTKQLTLRGIGMPVVDANGSGSAITLAADGIILDGFTATEAGFYPEAGIKVTSNNSTLSGIYALNNLYGIYLSGSSNNTLSGNNVFGNMQSISLNYSSNNTLNGNNVSNNQFGISLFDSSNNALSGNNVSNNEYGISVGYYSSNNNIYDNFFNNLNNIYVDNTSYSNTWNTTRTSGINIIKGPYIGGNVWAIPPGVWDIAGTGFSQTCFDTDNDGICDSPYTIDSNNTDYLPLAYKPPNILKGDLNDNGISADAGDLVLMKRASIGEIQADSRYDLNNNGQNADAGDLVLMKRASIGEIISDNGSQIKLNKGQMLVITLEANPTTGYTWEVVESNMSVIRQVGEIEFQPESSLIGAGGVQTLRFETMNVGQTPLKLIYHRPWEKDVKPLKTFSLQVIVK